MSPFKQTLRELNAQKGKIAASVGKKTPKRVNRWFKWLSPGLFVKRWLLISLGGVFLTSFGLAIWVKLTPVNRFLEFVSQALETIARLVPNSVSGPLAVLLGIFLLFWGQSRTVETITEALQPDTSEELVDRLKSHRRLHRGPKIVAIGGGTGLSTLLRGLKQYSSNITAIVTVADDGGSSGRLRREMGILPPGDIRNCIAALADEEKLLTELFQYRFQAGDGLSGHSFGNLFISAMTEITGDLEQAIDASAKVLAIRGKVLPATLTDVSLWAKLADGRIIEGESKITEAMGQIRQIGCHPADPVALPAALAAIKEADYIIIGPGSLYTSIIPNLLVPAIRQALARVTVPRIYVCNIMTQPGETDNYSVADHLRAIEGVCEERVFDAVLTQKTAPSPQSLQLYAQEHSHPVFLDREEVGKMGYRIVLANVMAEDEVTAKVRHDPQRLARVLWRWYTKK
ncbi:MAG: YvcK family protein [Microcystis novacekii Mn_MB_F_20050700_S1]|uniref:Putative gluconeogenesis factor n=1 Tax=Microcystis novacekii Mn_MB_F_20050700_S1D TaxID=2486266 RepID=A0A552IPI8_9CHRO|nr:MAG: YvcK family protein [Microcystis novacekii Mn_MB_F_20050700_S1]TRU85404.1 MAG: YvcK family protein [Microcystis novacekii Mn_MB_F_20050700_S1D]